ncbi:MAG: hypothetical protein DRZ79_00150 [Candidatus Cloacimonadota bacterium]|nr:MAG: hypothetical protein DRZ79_00150 [Candidatus Cloacimonadota bacterium]
MENLFFYRNQKIISGLFGQFNFNKDNIEKLKFDNLSQYPEITWDELKGEEYEILEVGEGYTLIRYKGKIYIVYD